MLTAVLAPSAVGQLLAWPPTVFLHYATNKKHTQREEERILQLGNTEASSQHENVCLVIDLLQATVTNTEVLYIQSETVLR
jgi:hypothetical protein